MADGIAITPGVGVTVQTDDVGGVHYQRVKRSVGADGSATDFLDKSSRSDTFTGTGNGTTVDISSQGMSKFAIQVKATGAVTSWDVRLEISLNGTQFTTIAQHDNTVPGDGITLVVQGPAPALFFRSRCNAISLGGGTNVVVTILALP